jgi:hypothetical protein
VRCHFDESRPAFNVRPFQAQDFLCAKSCKRSQSDTRRNLWGSVLQQRAKLGGHEDFNRCRFPVALFHAREQIGFFRQPIVFLRKPEERPQRAQEIVVTAR